MLFSDTDESDDERKDDSYEISDESTTAVFSQEKNRRKFVRHQERLD